MASSWSALKADILAESDSKRAGLVRNYTTPTGQSVTYTTAEDRIRWLRFIDEQIRSTEEGLVINFAGFADR